MGCVYVSTCLPVYLYTFQERATSLRQTPTTDEPQSAPIRRWVLERLSRIFLVATGVAAFGLLISFVIVARRSPDMFFLSASASPSAPTRFAVAVVPSPTPDLPLIAILAGHSGGIDPGAICPDGLREVDVTTAVAARAKTILEARGYRVDILAEFDKRLSASRRDYSPRAFVAIHADSCVNYASGYKVARAANSAIAQEDDRLVRCVSVAYAAATLLPFHAGSITNDMTQYHGLNEIDPKSPGAILELGFLGSEYDLLKNRRALLAEGVANGVDDFMQGNACK